MVDCTNGAVGGDDEGDAEEGEGNNPNAFAP
jgi:hypothetical protein